MKKMITAAVAALMLVTTGAQAIPVLDQENVGNPIGAGLTGSGSYQGIAQTFTVGVDGVLSAIEFLAPGGFSDRLDILSTAGGVPVGGTVDNPNVLGTANTGVAEGGWLSYDVSALNISVSVGDVLAFKVWTAFQFNQGSYSGGARYYFNRSASVNDWTNGGYDLIFRTYVEDGSTTPVPLPASGLLLGAVAAAGLARARKRAA